MTRRILILITDLEIGGTPTVVRELAIRLQRGGSGAEIEVACLGQWGPVADQLRDAGITVTALEARGPRDFLSALRKLIALIQSRKFGAVFSFLIHANALAAAAGFFCRDVRFIQSIQTTQPNPRWHWWLQAIVAEWADAIVVPSPSIADAAAHWADGPAQKIVIIPNAVEPAEFAGVIRKTAGDFTVGFIGRLDPIKRIGDLIEAVATLSDVRLEIFGEGGERVNIERQIAQLGLTARTRLRGVVARPQEALGQMDVLVLPSDAEGFGLVLIEAMAAGVPVVATRAPGIRDVVKDGQTGLLVPVRSPTNLAAAIEKLRGDAALRESLIANAHRDVRERFSWGRVIEMYRELLHI